MRASLLGKVELVRFLLKYGASCSPRDRKTGKTALALALTGTIVASNNDRISHLLTHCVYLALSNHREMSQTSNTDCRIVAGAWCRRQYR